MGPLRESALWLFLAALVLGVGQAAPIPGTVDTDARNPLFAQSAAQILLREFQNPDVSFLLLQARTGTVLAARWDDPDQPIPLGSLIKPFIALAYGEEHQFRYPIHECKGQCRRLLAAPRTWRGRHYFRRRQLVQFVFPDADSKYDQLRCCALSSAIRFRPP